MNYRHGYHAGNHADVLKHIVLLALLESLKRKTTPFFVLDTHAGRGQYLLQGEQADKTGEARGGIFRLYVLHGLPALLQLYLKHVAANNPVGALLNYPGSPLLIARSLGDIDRLVACELQPDEARALSNLFKTDKRVNVQAIDGYGAIKALLPPKGDNGKNIRGLVLIDPPYETQEAEFGSILSALKEGLGRWPNGIFAVWYPIKTRRTLVPFLRKISRLPCKSAMTVELLIRPDDSPLRMNGSGMLIINPPYRLDKELTPTLPVLARLLGERQPNARLEWIKKEASV